MDSSEAFFGVPEPLAAAMQRRGFTALSKVQRAVVDANVQGCNLRISSQTGSGKTVALGLVLADYFLHEETPASPMRSKDGAAHPEGIVIVPTRELAAQVRGELDWLLAEMPHQLGIECVTGGTEVRGERRALARGPRIVVGTPGRLLDHLRNGIINADRVAHVILDEADQMLDMGFKEELDAIVETLPATRRSHMVSATFPREVLRLAQTFQKEAVHIEGTQLGQANADIHHVAYLVRPEESYAALVNLLLLAQGERCLVFVRRRSDASELAEALSGDGFSALPFSGDLPQAQRTRTLNAFRAGIVNTLISTDVAARGIDVPDIATVIHGETPQNSDTYTHRSGRTGRAGRSGQSLLLVPYRAQRRVEQMLRVAKVPVQWQPIPTASKVMKAIVKKARGELHTRLEAPENVAEADRAYATILLERHDPQHLVATLLGMSTPKPPREPMEVSAIKASSDGRADYGDRGARGDRGERASHYEPFRTNWGTRHGATAARILSHLCRRFQVTRGQIGLIQVGEEVSTFGVASDIADQLERAATKPDTRDPQVRILRGDGSHSGRPPRSGNGRPQRAGGRPGAGRSGDGPSDNGRRGHARHDERHGSHGRGASDAPHRARPNAARADKPRRSKPRHDKPLATDGAAEQREARPSASRPKNSRPSASRPKNPRPDNAGDTPPRKRVVDAGAPRRERN